MEKSRKISVSSHHSTLFWAISSALQFTHHPATPPSSTRSPLRSLLSITVFFATHGSQTSNPNGESCPTAGPDVTYECWPSLTAINSSFGLLIPSCPPSPQAAAQGCAQPYRWHLLSCALQISRLGICHSPVIPISLGNDSSPTAGMQSILATVFMKLSLLPNLSFYEMVLAVLPVSVAMMVTCGVWHS